MRLYVKLFASLSRYVDNVEPGIPFEIHMPKGATVLDVVNCLRVPYDEVKVCFVKGRIRSIEWLLNDDDEIGIFPLIAGG